jgi:uridine kinase
MMERSDLLVELASRIAELQPSHPIRVAIDGIDAAGKTTMAQDLVSPLEAVGRPIIRSSIDHFHNPARVRHRRGSTSAEGYYRDSFDSSGLVEALLAPLGPGGSLQYRREIFDRRRDSPIDAPLETASPDSVLIFDGVFLHRPELRAHWDFSIFLRADFAVSVGRAEQRDLELFGSISEIRRRYQMRYLPGQRLYLAECQPEQLASIVVNNDDPQRPVIECAE